VLISTTPGGWGGVFLPTIPSSLCAVWYRPKHRHKEVNTVFPIMETVPRIYSIRWHPKNGLYRALSRAILFAKDPPIVRSLMHRNRGVGPIRHEPSP